MDNSVKLIIHKGTTIFDSVIVTSYSVIKYEQKVRKTKSMCQINVDTNNVSESNGVQMNKIWLNKKGLNAYVVSAYIVTLTNSQTYRKAALTKLSQYLAYRLLNRINSSVILIRLQTPKRQFLDYKWQDFNCSFNNNFFNILNLYYNMVFLILGMKG